jgi:fumarate reductase (CoM/CoB) subunit A
VLVVGAGGAGLRAAVAAAECGARVLVVDKGVPGRTGATFTAASDWMAFGAAMGHADPNDSPREHWIDIMVKGCLVSRPELSRIIAEEAPARLMELDAWGADFDKTPQGKFVQKLSDGARFPRAAGKGTETGPAVLRALMHRVQEVNASGTDGGVEFMPRVFIADLLVADGRIVGAWGWCMDTGTQIVFGCPAVVLAAGGAGRAFAVNVFPRCATGDGYALGLRAGVPLVNMEFIQIGPSIVHPFSFALSGVFWRLSPKVTNAHGQEFLANYVPDGVDLQEALRLKAVSYPFTVRNHSMWIDIGVFSEIAQGRGTEHNCVYMDVSHNPREVLEDQAAVPLKHLRQRGLDLARGAFEFAPAVQHFNGGVAIDESGGTVVNGLFAAGENAGGQHGADRPGGNALADCQVFGHRAGKSAAEAAERDGVAVAEVMELACEAKAAEADMLSGREQASAGGIADRQDSAEALAERLAWDMWRHVGVVRTAEGLKAAVETARWVRQRAVSVRARQPWQRREVSNMALVAEVVARAALLREESRGTHYRADCNSVNSSNWQRQILWHLDGDELKAEVGPIIQPPPELPDLGERLEAAYGRQ